MFRIISLRNGVSPILELKVLGVGETLMKNKKELKLIRFLKLLFVLLDLIRFPKYFSRFSRMDFDNWQLFALLVLRQKCGRSYDEFCFVWLPALTPVLNFLGLEKIPEPSTLRKFGRRLKARWAHLALGSCVHLAFVDEVIAGIDGTGISSRRGCMHYYKRIGQKVKKKDFLKVVGVADMTTQIVTTIKVRKKERHDNVDFASQMRKTRKVIRIKRGLGDRGFDAEKNHIVMEELGAEFIAPLKNKDVPVHRTKGVHRKKLKRYFPKKKYHQRSKKETIWFVVKDKYGKFVKSIVFHTQKIEILMRFLAYNLDRLIILGF